ncbi:MAG: heme exporter protein CcmD [Pseudomonadota bacterium]
MPDLGAYVFEVSLAYLGSLLLLFGIIGLSWRQARITRARLRDAEGRDDA